MADQRPPQPPQWDEVQRWLHEERRSEAERAHDKIDDAFHKMNEATISASHLTLRTTLIINGAAAIALLSFDGHLSPPQAKAVASTLLWFAFGVVASTLGFTLAYFTHYFMAGTLGFMTKSYQPPYIATNSKTATFLFWKKIFHVSAAVCGFGSLILFIVGMFAVRSALVM